MNEPRILIAPELRSYREAIAEVLGMLVPNAKILISEPEDLDRKVPLLYPDVVICSRATPMIEELVPFWVEMYRDHGSSSTIKTPERRWEVEGLELSDFASYASCLSARGA